MSTDTATGIIDFVVRPPAAGFQTSALYSDKPRIMRMTRDIGHASPPSYLNDSLDQCLAEMDAAGIRLGVVPGRQAGKRMGRVENAAVAALAGSHPQRFAGMGSIDLERADLLAQLDTVLADARLRGAVIEPGAAERPLLADDPVLRAAFGHCEDAGLPVQLLIGGNSGPDLAFSDPVQIDRLAARHPKLQIVVVHGAWPWVTQILGVAYRRTNLWIVPDMYLQLPGTQLYVDACNGYLQDRFLFASAYPALPFGAAVDFFRTLPIRPAVLPKLLHANAARLLALKPGPLNPS